MTDDFKKLLIITHTPSPNTLTMANAIVSGARSLGGEQVDITHTSAFDCDSDMVLKSDALILFTTENFGYMSGALKDFFDRTYYPCLAEPRRNEAKPFALIIKAGLDGTGTELAVNKITQGLNWKPIRKTLICKGAFEPSFIEACKNAGLTIAASLEAGII